MEKKIRTLLNLDTYNNDNKKLQRNNNIYHVILQLLFFSRQELSECVWLLIYCQLSSEQPLPTTLTFIGWP
jgi:hypothetical protein